MRERGTVRGNTENNNTCKPGLGRSLSEVLDHGQLLSLGRSLSEVLDHGQLRHLPYPLCLSGETIFGTTIFGTGVATRLNDTHSCVADATLITMVTCICTCMMY